MEFETREYLLTGTESILGGNPADPEVRRTYIESKRPIDAPSEDESALTPEIDIDKGLTVFLLHPKTGGPMVYDYLVRGFLKEALSNLAGQLGIAQAKSKVDKFVFVEPRHIPLLDKNEVPVKSIDNIYERSLRCMTMQGPRVTLAGSEQVLEWKIKIKITLLKNERSAKSKALTWDIIEEALSYGKFQGLGQFRNGGFGRFEWRKVG